MLKRLALVLGLGAGTFACGQVGGQDSQSGALGACDPEGVSGTTGACLNVANVDGSTSKPLASSTGLSPWAWQMSMQNKFCIQAYFHPADEEEQHLGTFHQTHVALCVGAASLDARRVFTVVPNTNPGIPAQYDSSDGLDAAVVAEGTAILKLEVDVGQCGDPPTVGSQPAAGYDCHTSSSVVMEAKSGTIECDTVPGSGQDSAGQNNHGTSIECRFAGQRFEHPTDASHSAIGTAWLHGYPR